MEKKKVLIVDDDLLTCQLLAKVLTLQKYTSIIVTDHLRVLDTIEDEKPSVILMDYHLGTGDGLEILQTLKMNESSASIPVIITSGMDYTDISLEAGAHAFLLKPFDWKDLIELIQTLLD